LSKGEELCEYLPPFPARGSGFHRYAFVLFMHERPERIDFGDLRRHLSPASPSPALRQSDSLSLSASISFKSRIFSTFDFYKKFEKDLTPAGLTFFQCEWDESVQNVFHSVLRSAEPRYHFEWPQARVRPMSEFPEGEPFDEYVERYRDPVATNELVLRERLQAAQPFKRPAPPLQYPNSLPQGDIFRPEPLPPKRVLRRFPTWLEDRITEKRYRRGIWKQLSSHVSSRIKD
jgi:large subunit ribosomal protein L38